MNFPHPWIRGLELRIGPLPDWQSPPEQVGPPNPQAILITSDGSNDLLRVRFRINKHASGTPMPGLIEVYNLGPALRTALQSARGAALGLSVGWENVGLLPIFSGGLQSAWSRRDGADIITAITCLSGMNAEAMTVATSDLTFPPGTSVKAALVKAAGKFPSVTVDPKNVQVSGTIGPRTYVMVGAVSDCLMELARVYNFHWAIIDNTFHAVTDGKSLPGNAVDINSENGFLLRAEPALYSDFQIQWGIIIHSLLNPWVNPNKIINLKSAVNPALDGSYVSWSVVHSGDTCSNEWETVSETTLVNYEQGAGF